VKLLNTNLLTFNACIVFINIGVFGCFRHNLPVLTIYIRRDENWYTGKL